MIPQDNYACGKRDQKVNEPITCEDLKPTDHKDCCAAGHSENSDKGCGENCADPACHCPVNFFANFQLVAESEHSVEVLNVIKTDFFYKNSHYNSSFLAIWLPPKLG
jgi:hypothetical protein